MDSQSSSSYKPFLKCHYCAYEVSIFLFLNSNTSYTQQYLKKKKKNFGRSKLKNFNKNR